MPRDATQLVGRERELSSLRHELAAAARGSARTVLIRGEPGVGKTALMQAASDAADGADDSTAVLTTRNLPLTTRVPNLAVRALLKHAGELERADAAHRPAPLALDDAVDRLLADGPVIVAIDDLQWADPSTLDALMFLAGGAEDRPLAILATVRAGAGRPVDRWATDLLRLPGARALDLDPLDRAATRELVAAVIGGTPHETLVSDVFERTRGNPYHARLLLEGVGPAAATAPATVAPDLGSAVLQAWSQLPPSTQHLCVMLALHGKPVRSRALAAVDPAWAEAERDLRPALATRVLEQDDAGRLWFHHPLIAEVLVAEIPEAERRDRHRQLARSTERVIDSGEASVDLLVDLADHLAAAGDPNGCRDASLRAVDALAGTGDHATRLRLLRRCVDLQAADVHAAAPAERRHLLEQWADAAADAGDSDDEYAAVSEMLEDADADTEPLHVAALLLRRQHLRFRVGGDLADSAPAREALRLASDHPDSREYALALVELAHAEILEGDPACAVHAAEAVQRATALGDTEVLSSALATTGQVAALMRDLPRARELAERTRAIALPARHFWSAMLASFWEAYAEPDYRSAARTLSAIRADLEAAGAPYVVTATVALTEARTRITIGEIPAARAAFRHVRAEDPPRFIDLGLRTASALLAAFQGRADDAEAHLRRAVERFHEPPAYTRSSMAHAQALARFARNDAAGALAAVMPLVDARAGDNSCEWLIPLAVRALADLADEARDRHEDPSEVLDRLDRLDAEHPHVLARTLGVSYPADLVALDAVAAAERARARRTAGAGVLWAAAAEACGAADLAWEEAYACRRGAEADLTGDGGEPARGRELLRRAATLARRLEADALLDEVESLALWSRVRLYDDETTDAAALDADGLETLSGVALTRRERELLPYIVDGRTYAEIAALLTISEKTVSSHISNLLRKTGAANRVDLARMAEARERSA
ncbi:LuxR family transcriptional regulator [Agromyces indicus]|uniref:helix-turn-helix transcriptional regulator n=1 Tax=Agromyces indicus TaxID=758919 RepID=UPI0031CDD3C8